MRITDPERAVVRALFEAVIPGSATRPGAATVDLVPHHEAFLSGMPRAQAAGIRALFLLVALVGPLLLLGRARTLVRLPAPEREELVSRLTGHRIYLVRQLGLVVKMSACFSYFQHDDVRRAYDLPPVADPTVTVPRRVA